MPATEVKPERILCAAIYVDTGQAEPPRQSATYPATGIVFPGWRHADCFMLLDAWASRLTAEERASLSSEQLNGLHQGFLTSTGRYVDRREGWRIALAAGQVVARAGEGPILTSEDLY